MRHKEEEKVHESSKLEEVACPVQEPSAKVLNFVSQGATLEGPRIRPISSLDEVVELRHKVRKEHGEDKEKQLLPVNPSLVEFVVQVLEQVARRHHCIGGDSKSEEQVVKEEPDFSSVLVDNPLGEAVDKLPHQDLLALGVYDGCVQLIDSV